MKKNWKNNRLGILVLVLLMATSCGRDAHHDAHVESYTCPMHPTVVSHKHGVCPVCGMELVRKARPGEEVQLTGDLAQLTKSTNEVVVASIKTTKAEFKALPQSITVQGVVSYDPRNIYTIPAKIGGRLERVFIKYEFQPVQKGQKIAEIYSTELMAAQRELLYVTENDETNAALIASVKQKLLLFGVSDQQIGQILLSNEVVSSFPIYSPYNGYVIRDRQSNAASSAPSFQDEDKMTSGSAQPINGMTVSGSELIREGDYVAAGQTLFKVVNTTAVRIELNVPLSQRANIRLNDEVDVILEDNEKIKARIDFLQPFSTQEQEFITVRLNVNNPALRIGQLVRATITLDSQDALWIPRNAVVDLGNDKIIFVKDHGVFKPRKVQTGSQTVEWVQVTAGLSTADELAINAQYLMDGEAFIKVK